MENNQNLETTETVETTETKETVETGSTLTIEQVQKMIQSENDKIRTEYSKRLKEKDQLIEQEKVKHMNEKEKQDYEREQERLAFEKEREELQSQRLELSTIKELNENNLDISLLDYVKGKDIKQFKETFDKLINEEVEKRINQKFKQSSLEISRNNADVGTLTLESFNNLSYKERNELFKKDPDIIKKLQE